MPIPSFVQCRLLSLHCDYHVAVGRTAMPMCGHLRKMAAGSQRWLYYASTALPPVSSGHHKVRVSSSMVCSGIRVVQFEIQVPPAILWGIVD